MLVPLYRLDTMPVAMNSFVHLLCAMLCSVIRMPARVTSMGCPSRYQRTARSACDDIKSLTSSAWPSSIVNVPVMVFCPATNMPPYDVTGWHVALKTTDTA